MSKRGTAGNKVLALQRQKWSEATRQQIAAAVMRERLRCISIVRERENTDPERVIEAIVEAIERKER